MPILVLDFDGVLFTCSLDGLSSEDTQEILNTWNSSLDGTISGILPSGSAYYFTYPKSEPLQSEDIADLLLGHDGAYGAFMSGKGIKQIRACLSILSAYGITCVPGTNRISHALLYSGKNMETAFELFDLVFGFTRTFLTRDHLSSIIEDGELLKNLKLWKKGQHAITLIAQKSRDPQAAEDFASTLRTLHPEEIFSEFRSIADLKMALNIKVLLLKQIAKTFAEGNLKNIHFYDDVKEHVIASRVFGYNAKLVPYGDDLEMPPIVKLLIKLMKELIPAEELTKLVNSYPDREISLWLQKELEQMLASPKRILGETQGQFFTLPQKRPSSPLPDVDDAEEQVTKIRKIENSETLSQIRSSSSLLDQGQPLEEERETENPKKIRRSSAMPDLLCYEETLAI